MVLNFIILFLIILYLYALVTRYRACDIAKALLIDQCLALVGDKWSRAGADRGEQDFPRGGQESPRRHTPHVHKTSKHCTPK